MRPVRESGKPNATTASPVSDSAKLREFSRSIAALDLMPLWERATPMTPGSPCVSALWRHAEIRPRLLEATRLITKRDAERRVLVLENPSLKGSTYITNTLYTGLQIIMPGEIARPHRHTPSALRFVVEGEGAYTAVAGERIVLRSGDFIVTPNWAWHDHGNLGDSPVAWLDGLDTPFARFFGAQFREDLPSETQTNSRAEGDVAAVYGAGMLPVADGTGGATPPILRYPYERTRAVLDHRAQHAPVDPVHGVRLRYVDPRTGGHPFPTMAVFMQLLPAGYAGRRYRSTDGTVFVVVEDEGTIETGAAQWSFTAHDIFVVPPWCLWRISAARETVLFGYSDLAAQEALGLCREQRE